MDSIHKYREVANACDKKKNMMVWAFEMLWDWWNRTDGKDTISIRTLRGEIPGWGGKSLIDLFLFKRTLRDALHQLLHISVEAETHISFVKSARESV